MAYTYGGDKVGGNLFGGIVVDGNRVAMTGSLGAQMLSKDAAASPVTSPISNGSGSGLVLKVPQNAVQITINSSVTCLVGEDSTYTYGLQIPASTLVTLDVARQQSVYLLPSSGTNTIWFQFKLV